MDFAKCVTNGFCLDSGFRRNADISEIRTPQELIKELVTTISCGGNFLINVGPTKDGMIPPILEERLLQIGQWLGINGEAIYNSIPWKMAQNDSVTPGVWYTAKPLEKKTFAIILEESWPTNEEQNIVLGSLNSTHCGVNNIGILGLKDTEKLLAWKPCDGVVCAKGGTIVNLPNIPPNSENRWAWTLVVHHH